MKCLTCGKEMVQIGGWFLGGARFECLNCTTKKPTRRFVVKSPTVGTLGVYSFGIVHDTKHNRYFTEKQFKGRYCDTNDIIADLNKLNYNDCDDWRLPYPIELLDLMDLDLFPTSDFPGIEQTEYLAHMVIGNGMNGYPIVDFTTAQIKQVSAGKICKFILIQN